MSLIPNPRNNVKHVFSAKCRKSPFQNRANRGQPNHMRLYTVMDVVQCKWGQKVEVNACLRSQMIFHCLLHKTKSEGLLKFMKYVNSVEKHTGYQVMKLNILAEEDVKVLRSDSGGEYTSNKFITDEFTVPYCPQQNGVAGQLNRPIIEGARSMLYHAKKPQAF